MHTLCRLRDNLNIIEHPREAGKLAEMVEDTGGVYFVTVRRLEPLARLVLEPLDRRADSQTSSSSSLAGLLGPLCALLGHARDVRPSSSLLSLTHTPHAHLLTLSRASHTCSGMMIGLSTYTTKHHIARATLESTCFQTRAILDAMTKDVQLAADGPHHHHHHAHHQPVVSERKDGEVEEEAASDSGSEDGEAIRVMQVDGGMTGSDVTMQLQADILGIDIRRPAMRECVASLSPSLDLLRSLRELSTLMLVWCALS